MAKSTRIIDIWMYINNKNEFSAQELADEFEVSLRTIQRDLDELSLLGVPFYSVVGRNGGYKMLHNNFLPPISFSFSEILSILITYETLNNYINNPLSIESKKVQEKLFKQLPNNKQEEANIIKDYLVMWQNSESYHSDYVEDILNAAVNKKIIEINYASRDKQSKKKVVPLGLFGREGNWYFPAYVLDIDEIRMFRSDRVQELKILEKYNNNLISLNEWLTSKHQFKDGIKVKMELTRKGCFELTNIFSIPIEKIADKEVIYHEDIIRKSDLDYFVKQCLRLGREIKIIEPEIAILKMKEELEKLNTFFKNNY